MPQAEPLEPTDIWTSDGRRVQEGTRLPFGPRLPFDVPVQAIGALALAPVAAGALAAGVAMTAGVVAAGVATAAARSLLGGGPPPFVVGLRFGDEGVEVMVLRRDGS